MWEILRKVCVFEEKSAKKQKQKQKQKNNKTTTKKAQTNKQTKKNKKNNLSWKLQMWFPLFIKQCNINIVSQIACKRNTSLQFVLQFGRYLGWKSDHICQFISEKAPLIVL